MSQDFQIAVNVCDSHLSKNLIGFVVGDNDSVALATLPDKGLDLIHIWLLNAKTWQKTAPFFCRYHILAGRYRTLALRNQ